MELQPEQLESICQKIQKIHWNPERNGGFFEYYVPIHGDGLDWRATRLSVTFNGFEKPEYDFMAWIVCPTVRFGLFGVRTVEQFFQMYELLTGKKLEGNEGGKL